jgi:UDP-N-acetylmuramyl pentapeptide phosphotransferase/UDP-N-acetylglucosamine-1-phosphate transferase
MTWHRLIVIALQAGAISAFVSICIVLSQSWHGKLTLDSDLNGVQKFHKRAVPRIGGLAIFAAVVLMLWLAGDRLTFEPSGRMELAGLLVFASLPAFVAGVVEDMTKRVSARLRLMASIASALSASLMLDATVADVDIWGVDFLLTWPPVALAVTAVFVAGGVNAVNIIDGFNGLAATVVSLMLLALGLVGWHVGDTLVTALAFLGLGATVGFLLVNYPNGRLFLGDGGAYFLGFWVAELAVLLLVRNPVVNPWQVLSICAYPIIEVLYSIYRRKFVRKASPGSPDCLHLHTLVYRRLVPRVVSGGQAWRRNAAVVCLIAPFVALALAFTVLWGHTLLSAVTLVGIQLAAYIAVYARLVRGRWWPKDQVVLVAADDVQLEA